MFWYRCKRILDVIVAVGAQVAIFPVFVLIGLTIKLTSPGPVFYRWHVVGLHGRPFMGYKFRTMTVDADEIRDQLDDQNEMTGPYFKMTDDPRVTPLGRVLRKYSLDELPQLWSVLKGDMSLIGPRPVQVREYQYLKEWQRRRNSVIPGCVGSWQVHGKTSDFDEMVEIDLRYIDTWSLSQDIRIFFGAIRYILLGQNH